MNERTHFFINVYLSHFILERVDVSVVCERWVETGTDYYIDSTLLLTIARCVIFKNSLSTSWLGLLNQGSLRATASVYKLALTLAFLSLTDSTAAGICLYSFITPTYFRFFFRLFTQVHLWLTAQSRVNIQQWENKKVYLDWMIASISADFLREWLLH